MLLVGVISIMWFYHWVLFGMKIEFFSLSFILSFSLYLFLPLLNRTVKDEKKCDVNCELFKRRKKKVIACFS